MLLEQPHAAQTVVPVNLLLEDGERRSGGAFAKDRHERTVVLRAEKVLPLEKLLSGDLVNAGAHGHA
jgi:hypothetical protein